MDTLDRRSFVKGASLFSALAAHGLPNRKDRPAIHEVAPAGFDQDTAPKYSIRFGVIGLDHNHIMGMTAALVRGGGQPVAFYSTLPKAITDFQKLYPNARLAKNEDEILNDTSISLI